MPRSLHPAVARFLACIAKRKPMPKRMHPEVAKYYARLGRKTKGRKVPTRRPKSADRDPDYFSKIAKARWEKERTRKLLSYGDVKWINIPNNPAKNGIPPNTRT